ncbi:MAG: anaerobic ribonucleoside-triphosphate reductase [Planctomycetota bacterium]
MRTAIVENKVFQAFKKRDGTLVPFRYEKIRKAIYGAARVVAQKEGREADEKIADELAIQVVAYLNNPEAVYFVKPDEKGERTPRIEDVQDVVEIVLSENGHSKTVAEYKKYRKARELARQRIGVWNEGKTANDTTDRSLLLVEPITNNITRPWDRGKISEQLVTEVGMFVADATSIAKAVENRVIEGSIETVSSALVRELVNNELRARGYSKQLKDLSIYAVPRDFIEQLMYSKSTENSNITSNNPEAVNLGLAELTLKQWAMDTIFSPEVKRAHDTGMVHLHDLGYPHRVYCSSHSLEYIKKYGLSGIENLNTESKPAKSAEVLTGHLNTFLASMQAYYAGALGIAYINILYAPYLEGKTARELYQIAQELIFNGSQNAFSRGAQTLFLDFNIHSGVPSTLQKVPAIGPSGQYMLRRADGARVPLEHRTTGTTPNGNPLMELFLVENGAERVVLREEVETGGAQEVIRYSDGVVKDLAARGEALVTYGDFQDTAREFTRALLKVWKNGDRNGRIFEFPKCDFHVNEDSYNDPKQMEALREACELASHNGSTYFIFDRDAVTLSACCRLRTTIKDNYMLLHPESMRFCGFQNVTVNLPQAAFRAARAGNRTMTGFLDEIYRGMDIAVDAHMQKRVTIRKMMSDRGRPLWQIGKKAHDGKPYVELDKATYIIGMIGLDDALRFLFGKHLHEDAEVGRHGLHVIASMNKRTQEYTAKHGLKFTLEESPAESAARRFAKTDMVYFPEEARGVVQGSIEEDSIYYTNSVHMVADADMGLVERIRQQGRYHTLIESGAITHAFVGEERPSAEAIFHLVKSTFFHTQTAQLTISPEFTMCNACQHIDRGIKTVCGKCGSTEVVGETRVVGYFSKVQNWNKSKRYGELKARQRGNYRVETAAE